MRVKPAMTTSGVIHVSACHPGSGPADRFLGIRGLSKRHSGVMVLPAFGDFTGGNAKPLPLGATVYAVGGERVWELAEGKYGKNIGA